MKLTEVRKQPEAGDPEWRLWLDLVELAVIESQHPAWTGTARTAPSRPSHEPLLHGSAVRINPDRLAAFVRHLCHKMGIVARERVDPLALIRAGVERDGETLDVLADKFAVTHDAVAVLVQLSALPLLLNMTRMLDPEVPRTWQRGYCPVCGSWPALVEARGIQRERHMRCGCCGGDWLFPVLRCAFCEETDHQKLGSLLSEPDGQQIRVETCATCFGYLKAVNTLSALQFTALAMKDLSTVAFDLAAHARGYARPARPGWQLRLEIVQ